MPVTSFTFDTEIVGKPGEVRYFVMTSFRDDGEESVYSNEDSWTFIEEEPDMVPAPLDFGVENP